VIPSFALEIDEDTRPATRLLITDAYTSAYVSSWIAVIGLNYHRSRIDVPTFMTQMGQSKRFNIHSWMSSLILKKCAVKFAAKLSICKLVPTRSWFKVEHNCVHTRQNFFTITFCDCHWKARHSFITHNNKPLGSCSITFNNQFPILSHNLTLLDNLVDLPLLFLIASASIHTVRNWFALHKLWKWLKKF